MSHPFDDTIAAIATPLGAGALAVIRVSGPAARAVVARLASEWDPSPRVAALARLRDPASGAPLDQVLATYFPAPASYTGEDVVELSTHGGAVTPQAVLSALVAEGARVAEPGEFTRRAYLNGKLNLLQAEAVGDLIEARSPAFQRAALHQVERGLSARIGELRGAILQVEALLGYSIDFPEEDEPPVPPGRILEAAEAVVAGLDVLLATAPEGELLREGAMTVLAGAPNSGKSSLFNALLGRDRAIVTPVPGTTRDALEAVVTVDGYPFRLVDTAGLRDTDDLVEGLGIETARRYLGVADVVLVCIDGTRGWTPEEEAFVAGLAPRRYLVVRTKRDVAASPPPSPGGGTEIGVSVVTGEGVEALRSGLLGLVYGGLTVGAADAPLVTRERQSRALRRARADLLHFVGDWSDGVSPELASVHLGAATVALEELIGVVSPDDVLDRIFGQFCVGK